MNDVVILSEHVREEIERWKALSRDDVASLYEEFLGGTHGELGTGSARPDTLAAGVAPQASGACPPPSGDGSGTEPEPERGFSGALMVFRVPRSGMTTVPSLP